MWKSGIKSTFHVEFTSGKWKCGEIPADFGLWDKSGTKAVKITGTLQKKSGKVPEPANPAMAGLHGFSTSSNRKKNGTKTESERKNKRNNSGTKTPISSFKKN